MFVDSDEKRPVMNNTDPVELCEVIADATRGRIALPGHYLTL
jgi:hypothetical protein